MDDELDRRQAELPEGFKVAIVGAGFSGLAMARPARAARHPLRDPGPPARAGGTWSVNRYPDVRVDTISITYEFSFEKNYPWSEYFGRGAEVRKYLDHIAEKYGVHEKLTSAATLKQATFDESRNVWVLEADTPDGIETYEANVLVNAVGTFTNPNFPQFEGQESFEGPMLHPAALARRLRPDGQAGRRHRQRLHRRAAARARSPPRPSRCTSSSARRSGSARVTSTATPVEPEVRWLLDNFPGYWNWWRYMAIAALFQTHRFLIPDEEWKAQGGKFNPLNDKMRDDLTAYIKAQTGGRAGPHRQADPRLRALLAAPGRRQRLVQVADPRQRRARHRAHRPPHPQGRRDRGRHRSRRRRRSSPPPASRSSSTSGPPSTSARAASTSTTSGRRTARARTWA